LALQGWGVVTDEVLEKLPKVLTGLKSLESTNSSFIAALPNKTLERLVMVGAACPACLPRTLQRQGASLTSLEFRCEEIEYPWFPALGREEL
jgi:hypothetical protein